MFCPDYLIVFFSYSKWGFWKPLKLLKCHLFMTESPLVQISVDALDTKVLN